MDRPVIDPKKPFYFSAYVTERGMPDRIEFGNEMICASESVEDLVEACAEDAEEYGTRGYVFMAIPVRRVTKKGVQELELFNGRQGRKVATEGRRGPRQKPDARPAGRTKGRRGERKDRGPGGDPDAE